MKIPNQIIDRFAEAVSLHAADHAFDLRVQNKDPKIQLVKQITTGILKNQIEEILELGILEYKTWKAGMSSLLNTDVLGATTLQDEAIQS